jgi:hypothetical protein
VHCLEILRSDLLVTSDPFLVLFSAITGKKIYEKRTTILALTTSTSGNLITLNHEFSLNRYLLRRDRKKGDHLKKISSVQLQRSHHNIAISSVTDDRVLYLHREQDSDTQFYSIYNDVGECLSKGRISFLIDPFASVGVISLQVEVDSSDRLFFLTSTNGSNRVLYSVSLMQEDGKDGLKRTEVIAEIARGKKDRTPPRGVRIREDGKVFLCVAYNSSGSNSIYML